MQRTGDLKLIQELNRFIILGTIQNYGPISRSEIAKMNNISSTTVTAAVKELIQQGLVYEDGVGKSSGGRKPILIKFFSDSKFIDGETEIVLNKKQLKGFIDGKFLVEVGKAAKGKDANVAERGSE